MKKNIKTTKSLLSTDLPITALPAATALQPVDLTAIVQSGVTKKGTIQQVIDAIPAPVGVLLSANNLNDVTDKQLSRINLEVPRTFFGNFDPNGFIGGETGDMYRDQRTNPITLWICKGAGNPETAIWEIPQTAGGAGSGDMLSANNLSDVQSVNTSRLNLSVPKTTVNAGIPGVFPGEIGDIYFDNVDSLYYVCTNSSPIIWEPVTGYGNLTSLNNLSDVQDFDVCRTNLEVPKVSSGIGSPNGSVVGAVNDEYFDESTTPSTFWRCVTAGAPGIWEIPETNALNILTANFGEMNFQGNATPTTFSASSTPTKILGTYNAGLLQNFTHSAGRLTCTASGSATYDVKVATTGSLSFASDAITIFIAVNGAVVAASAQSVNLDGVSPSFKSISLQKLLNLSANDYVEVWVQNNSSSSAVTHQDISVIVGSPGAVGSPVLPIPAFPGFRQTAPVVVSNSTIGSLNGVGVGSFSIPANSLEVGDTLFLELAGTATRDITSSTIRIALSGGAYFLFDTGNMTNTSPGNFTLQAFMTVRSIGGPGVASIQTVVQTLNLGSSAPTACFLSNNSANFSTLINTTLNLSVFWTTGALINNSCSAQILTLSKL